MTTQEMKNKRDKLILVSGNAIALQDKHKSIGSLLDIVDHDSAIIDHLETELSALRESLRWHPYPQEKPNEDGWYDVVLRSGKPGCYYHYNWEANDPLEYSWCHVIAFRKRPAPYVEDK